MRRGEEKDTTPAPAGFFAFATSNNMMVAAVCTLLIITWGPQLLCSKWK
jgi:hypothetical protein